MKLHTYLSHLNLDVGTVYVDPDDKVVDPGTEESEEVPALLVGEQVVWQAPRGTYFDQWGDGGTTAEDVVIKRLREVLGGSV